MSMKNSSDTTIGCRTRDLPPCSTVPLPTVPPCTACYCISTDIFHTSIYLSNHSVYLQNSASGVSVCLPVKDSAAADVLTLPFIAKNSKPDGRWRVKNSAEHVEDNYILTGIPERCDSHEAFHCASLLRPLWSK